MKGKKKLHLQIFTVRKLKRHEELHISNSGKTTSEVEIGRDELGSDGSNRVNLIL
jgi:hypothetical protein